MNAKTTIRKVLFIAVWLCIGGGMLTLLLAAISKNNKGLCKDYSINIKGEQKNYFIDTKDVEALLMQHTGGKIKGQAVTSFNLHELEQMLEHNSWINTAEIYFDNRDVLHVTIAEKEPVARIFTTGGNSFYIDSLGRKMPLSDKLSARVPVFTGYPEMKKMTAVDSLLLNDVKVTANYIINNPFWLSQVAQVDITDGNNFEMIPVVGNHLVRLGNGEDIDQKFHRLMVFYKQVLSKTGFDRYKIIDVQYKGQVVTSRYAGNAKIDSVQLRRNVEKLLRQAVEAETDTAIKAMPQMVKLEADSAMTDDVSLPEDKISNPEQISNPNPLKSVFPTKIPEKKEAKPKENNDKISKPAAKPVEKPAIRKPAEQKKVPKAVMPKKPVEDANRGYN